MERASNNSTDEEEDEDDGGHRAGHDNATRTAARIYKKALKILKLKLYFENFFPVDTKKDGLPLSCWTSTVASIGGIDGGPAAARKMFYELKYGEKDCTLASSLIT